MSVGLGNGNKDYSISVKNTAVLYIKSFKILKEKASILKLPNIKTLIVMQRI